MTGNLLFACVCKKYGYSEDKNPPAKKDEEHLIKVQVQQKTNK